MTIYIYLYRLDDEPMYVGQAIDVAQRDKRHQRRSDCFFDKVLQRVGRENFTLEIVGQVESVPQGAEANELENEMMDKYETYYPNSGKGCNLGRAGGPLTFTIENYQQNQKILQAVMSSEHVTKKLREAWAQPGAREKRAQGYRSANAKPEAFENRSCGQKKRYQNGVPTEHREKLRIALLGNVPWNKGKSQEATKGEANPAKRDDVREKLRRPKSAETRQRMSEFQKGRKKSESHRMGMKNRWAVRKREKWLAANGGFGWEDVVVSASN